MRKSDVPVVEMGNAQEIEAALKSTADGIRHSGDKLEVGSYAFGVAAMLTVKNSPNLKQKDIVESTKVKQSIVSHAMSAARTADAYVNGRPEGDKVYGGPKGAAKVENLRKFWTLTFEGKPGPALVEVLTDVIGSDGEARRVAIGRIYDVFAGPQGFMGVANGRKFHPLDERNDQDDEQDDQDEQGGDDDDKTSWQERLALLVKQAQVEGASSLEILAVVNDNIK